MTKAVSLATMGFADRCQLSNHAVSFVLAGPRLRAPALKLGALVPILLASEPGATPLR